MSTGIFPEVDEDAIYLSRTDVKDPLSSFASYSFELDGFEWPSVEHYFQAMKFKDLSYQNKIRRAASPAQARKLGRTRLRKIRSDWRNVREVVMTRATYIKCLSHKEILNGLLDTKDLKLVENSQYDYFWGCGRDRRGNNAFGKVLMGVRSKLGKEAEQASGLSKKHTK